MLRHVILDNFIHFQGRQVFHLKPGSNLFMGENSSGKTSVFEAVRRCTGLTNNTSFSRPHFQNKPSASACIFEINNESSASVDSAEGHMLFSSLIRLPSDDSIKSEVFVKVVLDTIKNTVGIDLVKETGHARTLVNEEVNLKNEDSIKRLIRKCLRVTMDNKDSSQVFQELFREIETCVKVNVESFLGDTRATVVFDSKCEELLRTYIDKKIAFTFSVRGIGACQWSLSKRVANKSKQENYLDAQRRAEILQWYFLSIKEGEINGGEKSKVNNYFDILTDHCGFEFCRNEETGELFSRNERAGKRKANQDDTKHIPILKVPEGIIEAMNTSVMLGVTRFRSVFLEEPEKGMHPQMIVRMRDLILRKMGEDQKTVVVTSHHPSFLAPWVIPRLFIFKQREDEDGVAFRAIPIDQTSTFRSDTKLSRIVTLGGFSSLFYAKRIFFVEGDSDYHFLTTLRLLLIDKNDEGIQKLLQPIVSTAATAAASDPATFREFISSIQILSMSGSTYTNKMFNLCQEMAIEAIFLLDSDALFSEDGTNMQQFLKSVHLAEKYPDVKPLLANGSILEEDGIFSWKKGHLEIVVKELADSHRSLLECLKKNCCENVLHKPKKNKSRNKLFLAKEVTEENILVVTKEIAACCEEDLKRQRDSEMIRLIQFLNKRSMKTKRPVHPETK